MALPDYTVEIAFDSGYTTAAASRTWTDVSAYVEGGLPLSIGRGRQDEVSQVQPSRLSLTLNNKDGRFTPRLSTGAYYPNVKKGRPVRVTVTSNAVDYVRYTGYVAEWPVSWPDSSSAMCVVNLTSASRMARLGRGAELRSLVEEEYLADSPTAYYTLGEPEGSLTAADSSGNQEPALTTAGTGTDVVFGTATGPGTDGLTAATFAAGKYLAGSDVISLGVLECFFSRDGLPASAEFLFGVITTAGVTQGPVIDADGKLNFSGGFTSSVVADGGVHHVSWQSGHVLVDGVDIGSPPAGPPASGTLIVGGTNDPAYNGLNGSVSHVAAFSSLTTTRATGHADAGLTGLAGEAAGDRVERYASYGLIPAVEVSADAGSSTIGHFDVTGMTPVAAMQKVAETENGTLFDAKDGTLTFQGRDTRYTVASSFTLDVTAQEVEADLEPRDDDQFLVNDVTASANGVPAGRAVDTSSVDENGRYGAELDTVTDDAADALAGAQWRVYQGADPAPRYSSVTVDITNSSTAQAAAVLAADIGTRFTLSNLPAQAPGATADLFVEGYTETITATSHRITFNTSPADGYDVWTVQDPVFGQYDAYPIAY